MKNRQSASMSEPTPHNQRLGPGADMAKESCKYIFSILYHQELRTELPLTCATKVAFPLQSIPDYFLEI